MCADEFDVAVLGGKPKRHDQAVAVALDVENNAVVFQDACAAELPLDVVHGAPLGGLRFFMPRFQGLFRVGVRFPKCPQGGYGYDFHAGNIIPFRGVVNRVLAYAGIFAKIPPLLANVIIQTLSGGDYGGGQCGDGKLASRT